MNEDRYCRQIRNYILDRDEDYVFGLADLEGYGSYDSIRKELSRLVESQLIERLFTGIYWVSRTGQEYPTTLSVLDAVVRNNHWIALPGTTLARYELGLSSEPPQQPCFLSSGPSTRYVYCKTQVVRFQHCGCKFLTVVSPRTALVVSALMESKTYPIGPGDIMHLASTLSAADKALLHKEKVYIPARLRPVIDIICR